jgi:hypothetical protein
VEQPWQGCNPSYKLLILLILMPQKPVQHGLSILRAAESKWHPGPPNPMQDFAVYVHDLRHSDQDKCRKVCTTADGAFIETVPRVDLEAITPGKLWTQSQQKRRA